MTLGDAQYSQKIKLKVIKIESSSLLWSKLLENPKQN